MNHLLTKIYTDTKSTRAHLINDSMIQDEPIRFWERTVESQPKTSSFLGITCFCRKIQDGENKGVEIDEADDRPR